MNKKVIKGLKILGIIILVPVLAFGLLLVWLTIREYRPSPIEEMSIQNNQVAILKSGTPYSVTTWNIGYAGLGKNEDFFLDGGKKGRPDNEKVVKENLEAIENELKKAASDLIMVQEVDRDSTRTYHKDEKELLDTALSEYGNTFALNYDVDFVPVPIPPIGQVTAGQEIFSKFKIDESKRMVLPGDFAWPKKQVELDRCMLVTKMPVEGTDKDFVFINAHFSAYDDGSIRQQQLDFAKEYILSEYEKGNYVIIGGDWNQTFDIVDTTRFPMYMNGDFYNPIKIPSTWLEAGWAWGIDDKTPTYRLLNGPYVEGVTQTGVIDGFAVSPNIKVIETKVIDLGFSNSDHNPVKMTFELK